MEQELVGVGVVGEEEGVGQVVLEEALELHFLISLGVVEVVGALAFAAFLEIVVVAAVVVVVDAFVVVFVVALAADIVVDVEVVVVQVLAYVLWLEPCWEVGAERWSCAEAEGVGPVL